MKSSKSDRMLNLVRSTVVFCGLAALILSIVFVVSRGDSGVLSGTVTIGPNCPVERIDQPCLPSPEAYTSRGILVYKVNTEQLVASTKFDATGHYSLELPVGAYTVVLDKTGFGSSTNDLPANVKVQAGQITELNIDIDTGIR